MAIHPERVDTAYPGFLFHTAPRNVYWETTTACDLACEHCRADAQVEAPPGELTTAQGRALIDSVKAMGSMLIMTGGDPMKRPDLYELMGYARGRRVPVAITPATTPLLTREVVKRYSEIGVAAMGLSLDGPSAEIHDGFRNVAGTFDRTLDALAWAREFEIPVQVNTTMTADTIPHLPAVYDVLRAEEAVRRWSLFLLVPVGRGTNLAVPTTVQIDEVFAWIYRTAKKAPFHVGTVEAPQYRRYWIQQQLSEGVTLEEIGRKAGQMGFGVRDGNGVIFVSHLGEIYPAGFLPHPLLGNVKETPLEDVYRSSPALIALRDPGRYGGRCGRCEYKWACGGSRARAYAMGGDAFGDDPLCSYEPSGEAGCRGR